MALISYNDALSLLLDNVDLLGEEWVELAECSERFVSQPILANLTQPPFNSSAMDGYALKAGDAVVGAKLKQVGTSAAGDRFKGTIGAHECVRIFTGAPVPNGADAILIQENTTITEDQPELIIVNEPVEVGRHIRAKGNDFSKNDEIIKRGEKLDAHKLNFMAAANVAQVPLFKKPKIGIISTGDELAELGENVGDDQIISSNQIGLKALFESWGAEVEIAKKATDNQSVIEKLLGDYFDGDYDLIVTIGGVSVGDRDLVPLAVKALGLDIAFHRVALRPGKPILCAKKNGRTLLGLPGNPISALTCAHLFIRPFFDKKRANIVSRFTKGFLAKDIPENGPRAFFMRAKTEQIDGKIWVTPSNTQDSSHLQSFSHSNCFLLRNPNTEQTRTGELITYLPFV